MTRTYAVLLDGKEVAQAHCTQEGLYYIVDCGCRLEAGAMYNLMAEGESGRENLGLLVPDRGLFRLRHRVPIKRLGAGELRFNLVGRQMQQSEEIVPVSEDEPFDYLQKLDGARLVIRDGNPFLAFGEKGK